MFVLQWTLAEFKGYESMLPIFLVSRLLSPSSPVWKSACRPGTKTLCGFAHPTTTNTGSYTGRGYWLTCQAITGLLTTEHLCLQSSLIIHTDNACCHKLGTRYTLLRNRGQGGEIKKDIPVSFSWGKQFLPAGENFSKILVFSNSGTLFQENPSNVKVSPKLPLSQKSRFLVILKLFLLAYYQ